MPSTQLVEQELGHNPFSGALYAFTNRQRNKIKCVMWEDNGFVMYYKALAEEKFKWPKPADELLSLTGEQINWLLDAIRALGNKLEPGLRVANLEGAIFLLVRQDVRAKTDA